MTVHADITFELEMDTGKSGFEKTFGLSMSCGWGRKLAVNQIDDMTIFKYKSAIYVERDIFRLCPDMMTRLMVRENVTELGTPLLCRLVWIMVTFGRKMILIGEDH